MSNTIDFYHFSKKKKLNYLTRSHDTDVTHHKNMKAHSFVFEVLRDIIEISIDLKSLLSRL